MSKKNFGAVVKVALAKYMPRIFREETDSQEWVEYGDNNLFPEYLISLYHGSSTHAALVNTISMMIFGEGLTGSSEALAWIEENNLQEEMRKTCMDLKLQGGFYWEIKWSVEFDSIKVRHVPFEQFRVGEIDEKGKINNFYHCFDWSDKENLEESVFPAFNPETAKEYQQSTQILYCKPFSIGSHYYPKPDYLASMNWIEVDKQVAIYHNSNIRNGMSPGFAINWRNGVPPLHERQQIRQEFEDTVSGVENAGNFIMTWSDSGETAPEIVPFELSNAAEQYKFVSEESTNKIMIGHRATTPALFGVKTEGQLGATQEMQNGLKIFQRDVIEPFQKIINDEWRKLETFVPGGSTIKIESRELTFDESEESTPQKEELSLSKTPQERLDEYLAEVGEVVNDEVWDLVAEEEIEDPMQEYLVHMATHKEAFFKRFADPDEKSEIDTGLYKIRYKYSQNISDKSRTFCKNMVANSKANVSYRFEDIQEMGDAGINKEFAPKGENKYSIWLHKGGAYCHHRWIRQVYFRKRDENGKFLPDNGLKNDKEVPTSDLDTKDVPKKDIKKGWNDASTAPNDRLDRGKLN